MLRKRLLIVSALLIAFSSTAQLGLNKLKDKVNNSISNGSLNVVDNMRNKQMEKDTTTFNFSISLLNNASFFKSKDNKQSVGFMTAKALDRGQKSSQTQAEECFNYNRKASSMLKAKRYQWAAAYYLRSLARYANGSMTLQQVYTLLADESMETYGPYVEYGYPGQKREDYFAITQTFDNLAILYLIRGRTELAESFARRSLELRKEYLGKEHTPMAASYNNLSNIQKERGEFLSAANGYKESLSILSKNKLTGDMYYAIVLNNQAILEQTLGNFDPAEKHYLQAIKCANQFQDTEDRFHKTKEQVNFKTNYASLQFMKGDVSGAKQTYSEIQKTVSSLYGKKSAEYAYLLTNLGSIAKFEKKYTEAQDLLNQALSVYKAKFGVEHASYLKTKSILANLEFDQENFQRSLEIYREIEKPMTSSLKEDHPEVLSLKSDMALAFWKSGDLDQAKTYFDASIGGSLRLANAYLIHMTEQERAKFWGTLRSSLLNFYAFGVSQKGNNSGLLTQIYNLHIRTKGLILQSSQQITRAVKNANNPEITATYQDWKGTNSSVAQFLAWSKEDLQEQKINLDSLKTRAHDLEVKLSESVEIKAIVDESRTYDKVSKALKPGQAAIELIEISGLSAKEDNGYIALIVLPASKGPSLVQIGDSEFINNKVFKYYFNTVRNKIDGALAYEKLWQPVESELGTAKQLYISPDGVYNQIGISTLQKPDKSYVLDEYEVSYLNNTISIANGLPPLTGLKSATLLGNPNYNADFKLSRLPGTQKEVEGIKSTLSAFGVRSKLFLNNNATENAVLQNSNASILHIATHGFFEDEKKLKRRNNLYGFPIGVVKDNPLMRAGLFLADHQNSDGILFANEIANKLDLSNTKLVVLSACETAQGEILSGEGVYGLQRAFQLSGAQTLIMSLWKVEDDATKYLMTNFYKELLKSKNASSAFRKAQIATKAKYPHPVQWGGFILKR